jgi:hypothetical protein
VLVGGLGLGILASILAQRPFIDGVVVVERSPEVIELCAGKGYEIVQGDIYDYLRKHSSPFDCYMLDTWQGTGEMAWWEQVMPARRIIRNRFGMAPRIHCWAEDIMVGQANRALAMKDRIAELKALGARMPSNPRHWLHPALPLMDEKEARWFTAAVGTKRWEEKYGKLLTEKPTKKGRK